ncbi:adenosylmethionine decarboxylase [Fervidicoccus fontis]|jgi:S-adenosylmethionine decarboxylase|uniref:S-adenosylmethionine decarboxylase proenzyme n=2 Tax=Fervidicoccus fontis TaxID=683846 RepID=I0A316_FERFK|nr:adenosylmethionine decarboxylase [Fervidicoccus fontis]AFH43373.1 S-adenosylmethionine decarboxylase proenzyme [Fervidicoccus fontis Kam940]MBE9390750.1 adenosylmethionine decarboxylase [Fervidicoccus fontis]PNV81269.1 MAG: adenosylmethionine decarboxylase [Fervidicoccus sp.]
MEQAEEKSNIKTIDLQDMVVGKHVYGNLYDMDPKILGDEEYIRNIMLEAVKKANATLFDVRSWSFPGKKGGVSVLILVLESHLAIHTWTEYRYATLDIYTCGPHTHPEAAFDFVVEKLNPKKVVKHKTFRLSNVEAEPLLDY